MPDPTPTTVKRLFALSGNLCAFPGCTNKLVDDASEVVTAEICHIKGSRPGAKRHDPAQTDDERRAFENLLLLCPIHHTIVDGDPNDTYTVAVLQDMKERHEAQHRSGPPPSYATLQRLLAGLTAAGALAAGVLIGRSSVGTSAPGAPVSPRPFTNYLGMQFKLIPRGSFMMGSEHEEPNESPVHPVTISKPFYLGVHQVTQTQYEAVTGKNPSYFKGPMRPVECVFWENAQEFCRRLSKKEGVVYRLPTEAEWEYACRAGATSEFCFGDVEDELGGYAWYGGNSGRMTHPVGQKKPNAWGLHDMHGNVDEWCQDWYGAYKAGAQTDPTGPANAARHLFEARYILRGGSWGGSAFLCRCAFRLCLTPVSRSRYVGFRVARPLP